MALEDSLTMAQDFNMECLIIETDALEMNVMLTNVKNYQNSALVNLIRDINTILNSNACYSVMHSKRSANSLAHLLAQQGEKLLASKTTYFSCLDFALDTYNDDVNRNSSAASQS